MKRRSDDGDGMYRRSVRPEHGPGDFYYSMLPDMKPHPVMRCLCGQFNESIVNTWEAAGRWLDEHIRTATRKDDLIFADSIRKAADQPISPARPGEGRSK